MTTPATRKLILAGTAVYGDADVAEWDLSLNSSLFAGLIGNIAKGSDFVLNFADGDIKGNHLISSKILSFPLVLKQRHNPEFAAKIGTAIDLAFSLETAWRPLLGSTMTTIEVQIGARSITGIGAPLGAVIDVSRIDQAPGLVLALCSFKVYSGQTTLTAL